MRIAVDAMGGDFAPTEVVKGALAVASEDTDTEIVLVGDESVIAGELSAQHIRLANLSVRHASQVVAMDEHPAQAVRRKRDSSLVVAGLMVKSGEADATFSAGNTGAAMAVATLDIGRIPGIERPAIATLLPAFIGNVLLLDAGANPDSSPHNLLQYALLGTIYAQKVLGRPSLASVGLLNIGSEPGKGNELTKAAYTLLEASSLNFRGNVEGRDVFQRVVDVVVCDGFAGNVLLKSGEGVADLIFKIFRDKFEAGLEAAAGSGHIDEIQAVIGPVLEHAMRRLDYAEAGGAPLLGINGVSVIGHGCSHARAIANGIRAARAGAMSGYVAAIREELPAFTAAEQRTVKGDEA